ncbi:MAG: DUF5926 family protein [Mycobacteriales bacterium]
MVIARPFEGRADEADWVALREVVPAATAPLTVTDPAYADRLVFLTTVLPAGWPGLVRLDGAIYLALQTPRRSGDLARDLGQVLLGGLEAEPGTTLQPTAVDPAAPRVQDLIADDAVEVTVLDDFGFWVDSMDDASGGLRSAAESANASIVPTRRLTSVDAAYWCRIRDRAHLRWAFAVEEDAMLDALARLAAPREISLGEGTKYIGAFRASGILIPVWDVPGDMTAEQLEEPAADFAGRIAAALAEPRALTPDERRARSGLLSRQLTLA